MSEIINLDQNLNIKKIDKNTINIQIFKNEILISIVGAFNQNLNELEKLTGAKIFFRGNSITVKGKQEETYQVSEAIKFLTNKLILTKTIDKDDILMSVKKEKLTEKQSNIRSLKQLIKTPKQSVIARSKKQAEYIDALRNNEIIMALGPAGTGKSFLAVSVAITMLLEKKLIE